MRQMEIGYHASHEQYAPSHLLDLVQRAEEAGFRSAMCSDHLTPFSNRQGSSGYAWSWLGAALASTSLSFGTVTAPGQRYHPAVVAQAIATLAEMFPGRFWVALGSGQFLNEHVTGDGWPPKEERNQRLLECARAIRGLLGGELVSHDGRIRVDRAKLYVQPRIPARILAAAITAETAEWAASWSDGLITVYQPEGKLAKTLEAYRSGGGEGKPVVLQAQHQYGRTYEEGLAMAHEQWRQAVLPSSEMTEFATPDELDAATDDVTPAQVAQTVRVSADPAEHVAWIEEYHRLGIETVYVHNVGKNQEAFIEAYGRGVLPAFGQGRQG